MIPRTSSLERDFPASGCYLIGLSGGRDSVALLESLVSRGYRNLVVCHLNHRLRGRASAADVGFVRKLAASHKLRLEIGSASVIALAKRKKISIEAAGREARYVFFARVAKKMRCRAIFLGHHADDLVETLLINLFRGTGFAGLSGMREVSERIINGTRLTMVRPLLGTWRREIDAYIKSHKLEYRDDATNRDLEPLRNRIRLRALPYLERTLGRNIRQSLWRTAQIAAEEEALIDQLAPVKSGEDTLAVKALQGLTPAMQRRTLRNWLRDHGIADVGFDVIERVRGLLDVEDGPAKTNLPKDRHARRRAGKLFLE